MSCNKCEKQLCSHCSGSGEGMWDGSTCIQCHGWGVVPCEHDIESAEMEQCRRDDAEWDAYRERRDDKYLDNLDKDNGEI